MLGACGARLPHTTRAAAAAAGAMAAASASGSTRAATTLLLQLELRVAATARGPSGCSRACGTAGWTALQRGNVSARGYIWHRCAAAVCLAGAGVFFLIFI